MMARPLFVVLHVVVTTTTSHVELVRRRKSDEGRHRLLGHGGLIIPASTHFMDVMCGKRKTRLALSRVAGNSNEWFVSVEQLTIIKYTVD